MSQVLTCMEVQLLNFISNLEEDVVYEAWPIDEALLFVDNNRSLVVKDSTTGDILCVYNKNVWLSYYLIEAEVEEINFDDE